MNIQEYLQNELRMCTQYSLTSADSELLETQGTQEYLFHKLTSKKFRKWALDEATVRHVRQVVHRAVAASKPLEFRFGFGGYKLWRLPTAPEADWAEFLALAYYCRYLAPLAAAYKPGVQLTFLSEGMMAARLNNLPPAHITAYGESFHSLLAEFRVHFAPYFQIKVRHVSELYDSPAAFEQALGVATARMAARYARLHPAEKEAALTSAALNFCWKGAEDLSRLSEAAKQVRIEQSALTHDAYRGLAGRNGFLRSADAITLFAMPTRLAIPVGSTKSSVTKFWTGFGMLTRAGDSFRGHILSPTQLEMLQAQPRETVPISLIPLKNFAAVTLQ